MNDCEKNTAEKLAPYISVIIPIIITLFWFFNIYAISMSNDRSITELKADIKNLQSNTTEIIKELEIMKGYMRYNKNGN